MQTSDGVLSWLHFGDLHIAGADEPNNRDLRRADGSDRDRIGAWPEKGILDAQPGPNREERTW